MKSVLLGLAVLAGGAVSQAPASLFDYDATLPRDWALLRSERPR